MRKLDWLTEIEDQIGGLPKEDVTRFLEYYGEMLDDRVEGGISEEEAIAALGTPRKVAEEILAQYSLPHLVKERIKPRRRLAAWEILLLVLGSPIWLSLAIVALAVFLSVYIVIWSVLLTIAAVTLALALSSAALSVLGILLIFSGTAPTGTWWLGVSVFAAGLAILFCLLTRVLFVGVLHISRGFLVACKRSFIGRGKGK